MKVLIIDDEILIAKSIKKVFSQFNFNADYCTDSSIGFSKWIKQRPDIVFLDVLMPKLNGPELLKKLGHQKTGKVILMSAYTGEFDTEKAKNIGADLFISKPFDDIFSLITLAKELYYV